MGNNIEILYHCQINAKWFAIRSIDVFFWAENCEGARKLLKRYISEHSGLVSDGITTRDFYIFEVFPENDTQVIRDKLING